MKYPPSLTKADRLHQKRGADRMDLAAKRPFLLQTAVAATEFYLSLVEMLIPPSVFGVKWREGCHIEEDFEHDISVCFGIIRVGLVTEVEILAFYYLSDGMVHHGGSGDGVMCVMMWYVQYILSKK